MILQQAKIYDELSALLTDYEQDEDAVSADDFYSMLAKIQREWETVITAEQL